ncbi:MAG: hypothetical protein K6B72_03820 [Lachnospiraceae bacterium]|nr:hypothetical protein [Lachnospiraceae bacterium]
MAGLDKILGEIKAQADADVEEILATARKEADEIHSAAEREAADNAERYEREAAKRSADRKARAVSAAALAKRQLLLAEKQKLIREVQEKAKAKFLALPDGEYFDAMIRLIEKNALAQPGQIRFNDRDLKRLPADFATKIENTAFKNGGRLQLSREAAAIDGGFVLYYDGIEQNCSVTSLFETYAEEISDEIQKRLF